MEDDSIRRSSDVRKAVACDMGFDHHTCEEVHIFYYIRVKTLALLLNS